MSGGVPGGGGWLKNQTGNIAKPLHSPQDAPAPQPTTHRTAWVSGAAFMTSWQGYRHKSAGVTGVGLVYGLNQVVENVVPLNPRKEIADVVLRVRTRQVPRPPPRSSLYLNPAWA